MSRQLKVYDSSATAEAPTRVHEIIVNGELEKITFRRGEATVLEESRALKFLQDGFTVMDENDTPYTPPVKADEKVSAQLKPGECIARFEELSLEALKIRAAVLPGGEALAKAKKDDVIAFLVSAQNGPAAASDGDVTGEVEMDEDGLSAEAQAAAAAAAQNQIPAAPAAPAAPEQTPAPAEPQGAGTGEVTFTE
jgi:hypothetical protein